MSIIPAGSLFITNDSSPVFADPDGAPLTPPSVPALNEAATIGDIRTLDDGTYCVYRGNGGMAHPYGVDVYDSQFNLLASSATMQMTGNAASSGVIQSDYTTAFYGFNAAYTGSLIYTLLQIDPVTAALTPLGTVDCNNPDSIVDPQLGGISPDHQFVYILQPDFPFGAIYKASAVGSASPMTLIYQTADAQAYPTAGICLRNGELLVEWFTGADNSSYVTHHSASGTLLHTYTYGIESDGIITAAVDDLSFWISTFETDFSVENMRNIQISDGTELHLWSSAYDPDIDLPFTVMPVAFGSVPLALTFPDTTGRVGEPYSAFLVASGGTAPYGPYAITVGTLPGGLTLNASTGEISGTPTTEEIQPFTAEVTDDNGDTAPCACFIRILAAAGPVDLNADTWVYDATEGQWHQRAGYDAGDDVFTRWRARGVAAVGSKVIVGDFETGDLYILDMDTFTDNDDAIKRLRRTPYLSTENQWLFIDRVELGIQPGVGNIDDPDPQVSLSISRDSGVTYSTPTDTSMGATGDDNAVAIWRALGRSRADRFVMQVTSIAPVRQVWGPGLWLKVRQGTGQR